MPFDALTMAAVVDDLLDHVAGGRIQKIIQPSASSLGLAVYQGGEQHWLVLSADAQYARVQLSADRLAKGFATPSSYIMLLRKYLDGARLSEIGQVGTERVLKLVCHSGEGETQLLAEIMGKHSNLILVGQEDRILGAIKIVPPRLSRVRPIVPGHTYAPPPPQPRDAALYPPGERLDPHLEPDVVHDLLDQVPPETRLRDALLGLLAGGSPFLIEQIALRAGVEATDPVSAVDLGRLVEAAGSLSSLFGTRTWAPSTFTNRRGRPDFAPYIPIGMDEVERVTSISEAIDRSMGALESHDALGVTRQALIADIERQRAGVERRLASLQEGLAAASGAERVMEQGQLLLAYQYALQPGASRLEIPELETTIPLDPTLSATDNAERLFRRYRKLRDAHSKIPPLIEEAEAEAARLADLEAFARLAESEADLRAVRRDLAGPPQEPAGKKPKADKRRGPARMALDGYTALVGRSARENEEVTFRLARRDDLWLHARERTGAHVILQGGGPEPPDDMVEAAAALAAYYSEGRSDSYVDVDVTPVRNVRKIPGGPAGRVTYHHFRTVRVKPSNEEWQQSGK